ncbi:hypothetical protein [Mesorhizobium sp. ES1-1]|uniref:hypothetical protein n=1 Tax=Mesorhizobium sp. ES1-1 TaxID=2876629 RepID=UPI001CCBD67A|nr:hypothetical protein [Mesorhizobium sp. ES1-1]MBZ9678268.1 hypothetical protein [Mesorhizobium sp. ES1-1]
MTLGQRITCFDWRSAAIAAPFAILLAWFVTAVLDRDPPIIYDHVGAVKDHVPQGGSIEVEFTVFRLRICDAAVKRWLIDSAGAKHSIPSFTVGPRPLAGLDTYRRSITIPDAAALGQASYQVELAYTCNIIHRLGWPITVASPPIRFTITPNEGLVPFPLPPPPIGRETG